MASEFGACRDKLGSDFFAVLGVVRFVETKNVKDQLLEYLYIH
jgi:hypothetical protein